MKKPTIKYFVAFLCLIGCFIHCEKASAQEVKYTTTNTYYWNPFETATAASLNSFASRPGTASLASKNTPTALNGSYSLTTVNNVGANGISARLLPSSASFTNTDTYEWAFLYKYTTNNTSTAADMVDYPNVSSGKCGWRYWVVANNATPSASGGKGVYLTQVGQTITLWLKASDSDTRSLGSTTLLPNTAYTIKIKIVPTNNGNGNVVAVFADPYTPSKKDATSKKFVGNQGSLGMSSYSYTVLEANEARTGYNCQWDDFKLYTPKFNMSAITLSDATVGQGQKNVAVYGFSINSRGAYNVQPDKLDNTGNPSIAASLNGNPYVNASDIFSGMKLYSSTDNVYSQSDTPISTITPNQSANINSFYSLDLGGTDENGTTTYYFYVVDITTNALLTTFNLSNIKITYDNYNNYVDNTTLATVGKNFTITQTYIWTGASGTTWSTASNWKQTLLYQNDQVASSIPSSGGYFYVPNAASTNPKATSDLNLAYLAIESNRSLTLEDADLVLSKGLNVDGTLSFTGGSKSNKLTVSGSLPAMANFTVAKTNKTQKVTLTSGNPMLYLTGNLTMTGGTLESNSNLTLTSNASGSASVGQITPSAAQVTGTVYVQRYFTGGSANSKGYRLLSSPVSVSSTSKILPGLSYINNDSFTTGKGGTTKGFSLASIAGPTLYFFREDIPTSNLSFTSGNYRGVSDISQGSTFTLENETGNFNLPAGNGFMFYFRGGSATLSPYVTASTAQTATLTSGGYLNQGDIVVSDWFTPSSTKLSYTKGISNASVIGYNLVGNPYASSIDWDLVYASNNPTDDTAGIDKTIYIYNPVKKVYATYQAGKSGVGSNFNQGSNNDIIPSGQGFFVVTHGTSSTLTFKETHKSATQITSTGLSLATAANNNAAALKYMRVQLFKDSLNSEESLIFFDAKSKTAFNSNEDAKYLKGNGLVNLSTRSSDNIALAINQMAFPQGRQLIPLNVNVTSSGNYQLKLTELKNIPAAYNVWLIDNYKKDSLDVKNNPTYSFNASTADTSSYGSTRFSLSIRQNAALAVHLLNFNATKSTSNVKINWTVENEANYTTYIVQRSTDGGKNYKIIDSLTSAGLGNYTDLDQSPILGDNYYRLMQVDVAGGVSYSNVIKVMYANAAANTIIANSNISVYPNPAQSVLNLAVTNTNSAKNTIAQTGSYQITITNSMGSLVKTETSANTNWHGQIDNLLPGTYFIQVINTKDNTLTGKSTFVKL